MLPPVPHRLARRLDGLVVLAGAVLLALVSARDFAGGWYDGSRLATVECLVDRHTFVIDHSIFVEVPRDRSPYNPELPHLLRGTGDRMWIGGHFYSDKSPLPAVFMAGEYQVWKWCTGWTARDRPDSFCYWMTVGSSGVALVLAVWCVYRLAVRLGLTRLLQVGMAASLAGATLAPVYARHVNNHILMLGLAAALALGLVHQAQAFRAESSTPFLLPLLGTVTGLGYAIDQAAGPLLLACTLALVVWRCAQWRAAWIFLLAAAPWQALHHGINFAVAGTLRPPSSVPEFMRWPGGGFDPDALTGVYNHPNFWAFLAYAAGLLVGARGFLLHNYPLLLAIPGVVVLLARRVAELPEILWALTWSVGTWLVYALFSNNYAGQCCSIRWLLPLLAPGFLILAVFLRDYPRYRWVLFLLSGGGVILTVHSWQRGPWQTAHVPLVWITGAGLGVGALWSACGLDRPLRGWLQANWLWKRRVQRGHGSGLRRAA